MVNEITLWVCDKCDTHPATFCHECFGCGEYMKPIEFIRRPTPLALDGGDSAASEQLSTPEVLSTLQGESTPAHRK